MAQIKKLQQGGNLNLNGKTYTAEQINEYINQAGLSSQERAALAGTINAIASGQQRTLDRNANSLSGEGVGDDFTSFYGSEKKAEKNTSGRSTKWSNRQARKNSDFHIANTAISKLGGIEDYYNKKKEEKDAEKTRLYAGKDENGFYTSDGSFLEGPENAQNITRINAIFDAIKNGDLSKYDLQDWSGDTTLGGLTDWWKTNGEGFDRDAFFTRMRENQLNDVDWEILTKMGFGKGTSTTSADSMHKDWKGNAEQARNAGIYMTKDADGNWFIKSDNKNNQYLGNTWYGGGLDFLSGTDYADGIIGEDGRLYTRQEIFDGKYQNDKVNAFLAAMHSGDWRSWYDAANASGVRFSGDRTSLGVGSDHYGVFNTQFNPYTHYNDNWSKYFTELGGNKPFDVADMSNNYSNLDGRQVLAYVDPAGSKDEMGIRGVKYVVRNADGSYSQAFDSEDALRAGTGLTGRTQWWSAPSGEFNQAEWENIGGKKYHLSHELTTQGDQQNVILQDEDGRYYYARKGVDGKHLNPKLINNEQLLQDIIANPHKYTNADLERTAKVTKEDRKTQQSQLHTGYYSPLRKEGGKIIIRELPKFQYGGGLGKSNTKSEIKSTEGLNTDITSTHKLNGSDGGLTSAEKMQIAAAVGDLAGVGLSFVPGAGNIAGAAVGLGSTATRFTADVKKDGFQAKDAWSAAGGVLLDLATVIPGLGTGAKTAKAVKAIKAAATPIMKVLSLAGAAQGVAAMGKVIRGEEITSEDLTAIISGLGSTAIAGKQLKDSIGDAKLAKKLATNAAKSANATNDSELVGTTLQKTRKEIANLIGDTKSEKEVVGKVQELLKQTNPEATTADARKVLQEWGVETSRSRFSGKNGWKEYLQFWKKGEKQVSFNLPKDQEAGSTLYYMLNPYARLKQTGFDWGYVQRDGNLKTLTSNDINAANAAVAAKNANLEQQALSRQTIENPRAFWDNNIMLSETTSIPGFYMGGNRYFRTASDFTTRGLNDVEVSPQPGRAGNLLKPIDDVENADVLRRRAAIQAYKRRKFLESQGLFVEPDVLSLPMPSAHDMKVARLTPRGNSVVTPDVIVPGPWSTTIDPNGMLARQLDLELGFIPRPYSRKGVQMYDLPIGYGRGKYDDAIQYLAFKDGGKLKFAKGGKNIRKGEEGIPGMPNSWNSILGQINVDVNKLNGSNSGNSHNPKPYDLDQLGVSTVQNAIRDTNAENVLSTPSVTTKVTTNYASDHNASGPNPTAATKYLSTPIKAPSPVSPETVGNPVGEQPSNNRNWNNLIQIGGTLANGFDALNASKKQMNLSEQMEVPLEVGPARTSFRYKDPGYMDAANRAAAERRSFRRNLNTSDQMLNVAAGMAESKDVSDIYQNMGNQRALNFQQQMDAHNAQLRNDFLQDAVRENANAKLLAGQKNALLQQRGAYIAQNQGIVQGMTSDLTKIGQQAAAGKKALAQFDAKTKYSNQLTNWQNEFNGKATNGLVDGKDYDTWVKDVHGKDLQKLQRDYLASQYKKGGKVRSAEEQIKIDNNKLRSKAIAQLSKQAFEFLKQALS